MLLGCSSSEINKVLPKPDERRKYTKRKMPTEAPQISKKPRIETPPEPEETTAEKQQKVANEVNEKYILDNLTLEKAVHLVITGLNKIPNSMPSNFTNNYSGFVKNAQVGQPKIIAKLLAKQFFEADVGPGTKAAAKAVIKSSKVTDDDKMEIEDGKEEKEKVFKIHLHFFSSECNI